MLAPNGSTELLDDYYDLRRELLTKFKSHFSLWGRRQQTRNWGPNSGIALAGARPYGPAPSWVPASCGA